ncbi:ATP synthase subunit, partial [Thalassiosira pseudonana CCMP1335]
DSCPDWAPAFGYIGAASCMILANFGSAWGTWKAGLGVCKMGVDYPKGVIKNIVPIVMAGVLGIYGLIVAVILTQAIRPPNADNTTTYSMYNGYAHMAAGLCCGISCLAAGGTIGVIGDAGAANADGANKLYVGLLIMLIFSEALALYGLIVALILSQHSYVC